jgi:peroxiredoxin
MTARLQPGDLFPALDVNLPDRTLHLPADLAGECAVVLIYRGSWCPYCKAQLAAFQPALPQAHAVAAVIGAFLHEDPLMP